MKQVITAKLKLHLAASQFQALRQTQLAYRDALNSVSRYAFAHGKKSNQHWLQKETYAEVRVTYHLPAKWPVMFLVRSGRAIRRSGPR